MELCPVKLNINFFFFFTNAGGRADLGIDGHDCNCGTGLPAGAAAQGNTHMLDKWR